MGVLSHRELVSSEMESLLKQSECNSYILHKMAPPPWLFFFERQSEVFVLNHLDINPSDQVIDNMFAFCLSTECVCL